MSLSRFHNLSLCESAGVLEFMIFVSSIGSDEDDSNFLRNFVAFDQVVLTHYLQQ